MEARPRADDRGQLLGLSACHDRKRFIGIALFWLNIFLLALIVRLPLIRFISWDYEDFQTWYDFIEDNGYFTALKYDFSIYNVPYLYLLVLAAITLPGLDDLLVMKAIPIAFSFVLIFFVYKCVCLKYSEAKTIPYLAALVTLFAPTVILNGAAWGQSDSIYTAFLIVCLWALLSGHQAWAFVAFGLSFSFKLQAVFLGPMFFWLLIKKQVSWRYLFLIPLVYMITIIPALFVGRPLDELLLIYFNQTGETERLTKNAPNVYQWIPDRYYSWYPIGILFTVFIVLIIALLVHRSQVNMDRNFWVHLATFSVLIVPFFLPKMHERYFFPADIIAIILAFYFPKFWYTPVIIGLVSLLSYLPFLYGVTPISLAWLALFPLALITVLGWKLLRTLGHLPPSRVRVSRLRRSARTHRRPPR